MKDAQPRAIYLKDYQAPEYWIDNTDLTFDLFEDHAIVTANLKLRRNPDHIAEELPELVLSGQDMELLSVHIDGIESKAHRLGSDSLAIPVAAPEFELKIINRIKPQENTSLEGLYKSNGMFCTQCEAEGFARLPITLTARMSCPALPPKLLPTKKSTRCCWQTGMILPGAIWKADVIG